MSRTLAKAWESLAAEQKKAAEVLRERKLHRASVGRAYYAAYSEVTSALVGCGMIVFGQRGNPSHKDLPNLVTRRLRSVRRMDRKNLASALRRMRSRREDADYRPTVVVMEGTSRESLSDLASLQSVLGRAGA